MYTLDSTITFCVNGMIKDLLKEYCSVTNQSLGGVITNALQNSEGLQRFALQKMRDMGFDDQMLVKRGVFDQETVDRVPIETDQGTKKPKAITPWAFKGDRRI